MNPQKYHVWKHIDSGDFLVRTTSYSLPKDLHDHIELIQPTTMFGRFKPEKSTVFSATRITSTISQDNSASISTASGISVDASCNSTITITCLQQLYNAVGFNPSAKGNSIGITGYLVTSNSLLLSGIQILIRKYIGPICQLSRPPIVLCIRKTRCFELYLRSLVRFR